MRIFDLYSKVASLPDGEYFFVNKNFMMQSDDWEMLQSKNKKSEK